MMARGNGSVIVSVNWSAPPVGSRSSRTRGDGRCYCASTRFQKKRQSSGVTLAGSVIRSKLRITVDAVSYRRSAASLLAMRRQSAMT